MMTISRRNLFRRGGAAAAVAVTAPVLRHLDVAALDTPDGAADLAAIPAYPVHDQHRSAAVCPDCYQPAVSMAQLINYDAWLLRCDRCHTWKVSGMEVVKMPDWMQREWEGALKAAKVRPPDQSLADEARSRRGNVNAMAHYEDRLAANESASS